MKPKFIPFLAVSLFAALACEADSIALFETGGPVRVDICASAPRTRSSLGSIDESAVHDFNVYFYRDGRLFTEIYCEQTSVSVTLHCRESYRIYALANVGRVEAPIFESDLADLRLDLSDFSAFASVGLPMSYASKQITAINSSVKSIEIPFTRLVARYVLHLDGSLSKCDFEVGSVCVHQGAADILPFAQGSVPEAVADADYASAADLAAFNAGEDIVLYLLENDQGELLSGNDDPWAKTADAIGDKASRCTYITLGGRWTTQAASADLALNMFVGRNNCSDFSVLRNTDARIEVCLSDESTVHFGWKVTMENCLDERELAFSEPLTVLPQNAGWVKLDNLRIAPAELAYSVSCSDSLLQYRIEDDGLYIHSDYLGEERPEIILSAATWDSLHVTSTRVLIDYTQADISGVGTDIPEYYAQYGAISLPVADAAEPMLICAGDSVWVYGPEGDDAVRSCYDSVSGTRYWFVPSEGALYARREAVTQGSAQVILKKASVHQYVPFEPAVYPSLSGGEFYLSEAGNAMHSALPGLDCDAVYSLCLTDAMGDALDIGLFCTPEAVLAHKGLASATKEFEDTFCSRVALLASREEAGFGFVAFDAARSGEAASTIKNIALFGNAALGSGESVRTSDLEVAVTLPDSSVLSAKAGIGVHKAFPNPGYLGEILNREASPSTGFLPAPHLPFAVYDGADEPPLHGIDWSVSHCILDGNGVNAVEYRDDIYSEGASVKENALCFNGLSKGLSPSCGPLRLHGSVTNPHTGRLFEADYYVDVLLYLSIGAQVDYTQYLNKNIFDVTFSYIPWNRYMTAEYIPCWAEFLPEDITVVNSSGQAYVQVRPASERAAQSFDIHGLIASRSPENTARLVSDLSSHLDVFPFEFSLEDKDASAAPQTVASLDVNRVNTSPLYAKYRTGEKGFYHFVRQSDIKTFRGSTGQENIVFEVAYGSMDIY